MMYFQFVWPMIKTRTGMMLSTIQELLQQLHARNSAIVTSTAIISRLEAPLIPLILDIVGSNLKRRQP